VRKLDRASVECPPCLAKYQHGRDNWNDVAPEHKAQIRTHLERMQGPRCAYCEGPLDDLGRHIEHFRCKDRFPKLTFDWSNLYCSCLRDDSCGWYKDNKAASYDANVLIDPCQNEPDHYFKFYSDGTVRIRSGLSIAEQNRAQETLRVFNLQNQRLNAMRQRAFETYLAIEPGIMDALVEFEEDQRQAIIEEEMDRASMQPFSAVIRHWFEDLR
jgi:uncharacterized protein (TIGR02646 family)